MSSVVFLVHFFMCQAARNRHTVDGSEIRRENQLRLVYPHYLQGFSTIQTVVFLAGVLVAINSILENSSNVKKLSHRLYLTLLGGWDPT